MVRIVGLEPTRRGHRNLNPTRLPIPSYPRILLRVEKPPCKLLLNLCLCPIGDLLLAVLHLVTENSKTGQNGCAGAAVLQVSRCLGKATAFIGAQGYDLLAGQVIMLQEGEHAHGSGAAPAGEADEKDVILADISI